MCPWLAVCCLGQLIHLTAVPSGLHCDVHKVMVIMSQNPGSAKVVQYSSGFPSPHLTRQHYYSLVLQLYSPLTQSLREAWLSLYWQRSDITGLSFVEIQLKISKPQLTKCPLLEESLDIYISYDERGKIMWNQLFYLLRQEHECL